MKAELDPETMLLWKEYLAAERVRIRQESLLSLERFSEALLRLSPEVWQPWARELAMDVVDEHQEIPIRLPLFRRIIFPALQSGLEQSIPGSARWLAGFAQALYKSPSCYEQLPENERSEYGLLLRAIREDATDIRAKKRLLILMRSRFDYVLHELPDGVLYGQDGATVKQCDELLAELSDYERLAKEIGLEDWDRRLIAEARYQVPAYRCYLLDRDNYASYEEYLSARKDR
jgi:PAS domain-containing protein